MPRPACSAQELFALDTIGRRRDRLTMTDLAGAMRVPLSPASRVVDRLVAKDLVVRAPLPEDRRVVHVRFSRRGKRINQFVADAPQAAATRPLEALPPRDSAAVLHALDPMLEERN